MSEPIYHANGHEPEATDNPAKRPESCPLTTYQVSVLQWVANGKRNAEIASIMGNTTEGAIEQHMYRIMNLLGCETRTAAAAIAWRKGWVK